MPKNSNVFRVVRRSTNRGSFGHRNYFLMNRDGVAFQAQRVYDLPMNGEVLVPKDEEIKEWDFSSLGFECPEILPMTAPKNVVEEAFKPAAAKVDLLALKLD